MRQDYPHHMPLKCCLGLALLMLGLQNVTAQEICLGGADGDQIRERAGNGYTHELWNQNNQGTACMTLDPNNGTFSAQWNNALNFLARRGVGYDGSPLTHEERGDFSVSYASNFNCNNINGLSYLSVYGWTRDFAKEEANPEESEAHQEALVEYYIIENWCDWNVSRDTNADELGTLNVDGSTYDIYRTERIDQPSIRCNGACDNFYQYFSIRRDTRNSGTIDVSAHFNRWEELTGIPMGGLHEVMMKVEGYNGSNQSGGNASFSQLEVNVSNIPNGWPHSAPPVTFGEDVYNITTWCGDRLPPVATFDLHPEFGGSFPEIGVTSSNTNVLEAGGQRTYQFLVGQSAGTSTITLYADPEYAGPGVVWDTATVNVTQASCDSNSSQMFYQLRAHGTQGDEEIQVTLDGTPVSSHQLTTEYQVYSGTVYGNGEIGVGFVNDDGVVNGRDVRLDYIEVNGERRETEAMTQNSAAYANGVCGGGAYTEWLHCNGGVNYGTFNSTHTITIRARGNAGGEHINLLIDGEPVNGGWWLGTSYQEYTATVSGDGDINVQFDNDGGTRDVIIDWIRVDDQAPRQAENMQHNTGAWANGQCGGGDYSQWLHCNGVIGFGNISDNFN